MADETSKPINWYIPEHRLVQYDGNGAFAQHDFESFSAKYDVIEVDPQKLVDFLREGEHNFLKGGKDILQFIGSIDTLTQQFPVRIKNLANAFQAGEMDAVELCREQNPNKNNEYDGLPYNGTHRLAAAIAMGKSPIRMVIAKDDKALQDLGRVLSPEESEQMFEASLDKYKEEIEKYEKTAARARTTAATHYSYVTQASGEYKGGNEPAQSFHRFTDGVIFAVNNGNATRYENITELLRSQHGSHFLKEGENKTYQHDVAAPKIRSQYHYFAEYNPNEMHNPLRNILDKKEGIIYGYQSTDDILDSISGKIGSLNTKIENAISAFLNGKSIIRISANQLLPYYQITELRSFGRVSALSKIHQNGYQEFHYTERYGASVAINQLIGDQNRGQLNYKIKEIVELFIKQEIKPEFQVLSGQIKPIPLNEDILYQLAGKGFQGFIQKVYGHKTNPIEAFRTAFGLSEQEALIYAIASYGSIKELAIDGYRSNINEFISEQEGKGRNLSDLARIARKNIPDTIKDFGYDSSNFEGLKKFVDECYGGQWHMFLKSAYGPSNINVFINDFGFGNMGLVEYTKIAILAAETPEQKRAILSEIWGHSPQDKSRFLELANLNSADGIDEAKRIFGVTNANELSMATFGNAATEKEGTNLVLIHFAKAFGLQFNNKDHVKILVEAAGGVEQYVKSIGLIEHIKALKHDWIEALGAPIDKVVAAVIPQIKYTRLSDLAEDLSNDSVSNDDHVKAWQITLGASNPEEALENFKGLSPVQLIAEFAYVANDDYVNERTNKGNKQVFLEALGINDQNRDEFIQALIKKRIPTNAITAMWPELSFEKKVGLLGFDAAYKDIMGLGSVQHGQFGTFLEKLGLVETPENLEKLAELFKIKPDGYESLARFFNFDILTENLHRIEILHKERGGLVGYFLEKVGQAEGFIAEYLNPKYHAPTTAEAGVSVFTGNKNTLIRQISEAIDACGGIEEFFKKYHADNDNKTKVKSYYDKYKAKKADALTTPAPQPATEVAADSVGDGTVGEVQPVVTTPAPTPEPEETVAGEGVSGDTNRILVKPADTPLPVDARKQQEMIEAIEAQITRIHNMICGIQNVISMRGVYTTTESQSFSALNFKAAANSFIALVKDNCSLLVDNNGRYPNLENDPIKWNINNNNGTIIIDNVALNANFPYIIPAITIYNKGATDNISCSEETFDAIKNATYGLENLREFKSMLDTLSEHRLSGYKFSLHVSSKQKDDGQISLMIPCSEKDKVPAGLNSKEITRDSNGRPQQYIRIPVNRENMTILRNAVLESVSAQVDPLSSQINGLGLGENHDLRTSFRELIESQKKLRTQITSQAI